MSNENLVLVYGSLKRGYYNHDVIAFDFENRSRNKGYDYLGDTKTVDKFTMYDLGSFPAISFDENGKQVKGELYAVDDATFNLIDILEGYPDHYNRIEVNLENTDVRAWIYFYENPEDHLAVVESPNDTEYVWEQ